MFPPLELATENYSDQLARSIAIVQSGREDPEAYFLVAWSWRILGLCRLLGEADVGTFADHLMRAGQARLAFLRKVRGGLSSDPRYLCVSKNVAYTAAVAAGDMTTARDIALMSATTHFPAIEYEDDFLFFHMLHRLSVAPDDTAGHTALLKRWATVLEGEESGPLAACRGLVSRKPEEFASGFDELIASKQTALKAYRAQPTHDQQLFAAEGPVYVEALAVLRFAELRGLPTQPEYPLVPAIARVPMGTVPPPADAWLRSPS